jgi:hypothetical protein
MEPPLITGNREWQLWPKSRHRPLLSFANVGLQEVYFRRLQATLQSPAGVV